MKDFGPERLKTAGQERTARGVTDADEFADQLYYVIEELESTASELKDLMTIIQSVRRTRKRQPNDNPLAIHWGGIPVSKVLRDLYLLASTHGEFGKAQKDFAELIETLKQVKQDFGLK